MTIFKRIYTRLIIDFKGKKIKEVSPDDIKMAIINECEKMEEEERKIECQ